MNNIFKVTTEWANNALVNNKKYLELYKESINNNEEFWRKNGQRLDWVKQYSKIKSIRS